MPWAWAAVVERLAGEGIRSIALDLPSKGADAAALGDLHDDAEVVRAAIAGAGAPALVVAHSYGGLPVSEGGAGAAHLIYLAAFMLEPGESLLGLRGGVPPDWWLPSEDGRTLLPGRPGARLLRRLPARRGAARRGADRAAEPRGLRAGAALGGVA